jgi:hypothetical protein
MANTNHRASINQTLEKLDFAPPVVAGLTGSELFSIAGILQLISIFILFPILGFLTGLWIPAFGLSMIIGLFAIAIIGRKIAKEKEAMLGAGDLVWLNYKIQIVKMLGLKTSLFITKEQWSCERSMQNKVIK